ncbi:uncharacterized protein [Cicer arietinum]|uniref:Uncharacterized protein LOC101493502 isoform X2 n=1 Tax=Cicer arietinum TaxID=3827 RepID=A0A1S2XUR9_CICAR|nr:uncharacterized protein LOC101493502 isoform X2 [Cicer arietinum]
MDEWKRSGQIPAFGNWDFANEMPITQYFESARQAGLIRYSSSSGESDPYIRGDHDLYAVDFKKPVRNGTHSTLRKATRNRERKYPNVVMVNEKETSMNMNTRKQGKVYDVMEHPRKPINKKLLHVNDVVPHRSVPLPSRLPKPVDEDLYKIPPELLRTTKRKKMLGFISKCLVPAACVS